jgi:metal-sulfur cluster biosynthetic enzyme
MRPDLRSRVLAALDEVNDPEYPISVVAMGLIRGVEVEGATVTVRLTYTTLGCPCVEMIQEDIRARLLDLDGVERVDIEEVFEPWSRADISAEGVARLASLGMT